MKGENLMGKIYSVGMTKNSFDVAPEPVGRLQGIQGV